MQAKYGLVLATIAILFSLGLSIQPQDAYANHNSPPPTFTLCHNGNTLNLPFSAWIHHLIHHPNDYVGVCITPPADNDEDGINNDDDECPNDPETVNGYQDEDGCPDEVPEEVPEDIDGDGITDEIDQCPSDPENFNGFQDEDGCPETNDNGGDCVNCIPPTLGLNKGGDTSPDKRLVEGGFTCNGQTVNVEHFYTEFPLITNAVGEPLQCTFKVYEDTGADKITHFEFAVGKRTGDSMSELQGKIAWDMNIMTKETTVTFDKNLFRDVALFSKKDLVKCTSDSENERCLMFVLSATPKQPLVEDIIAMTNVWDSNQNGKTNFYNDGIDFVGNSENPLPSFNTLDGKNGMVTIYTLDPTLEDQTHGVDKFGQNWYNVNGFWV